MESSEQPTIAQIFDHPTGARGRSTAQVAEFLRAGIVSGDLASGERINETEMAARLSVSRTPLREALKLLQAEGLVEIRPNRGAWVTKQSLTDVAETIELLICLEVNACEAACANLTEDDMRRISQLHHDMTAAFEVGDLMGYFRNNQAIHQAIVDCAANQVISRLYKAESARVRRFRYAGNEIPKRWNEAAREHEQILEALGRRQAGLLRELLRAHHHRGWAAARDKLESDPEYQD